MAEYLVTWKIEVEAGSLLEAARMAQDIQRDYESTATVFLVAPRDVPSRSVEIDLAPPDDEETTDEQRTSFEPVRDDLDTVTPWTVRRSITTKAGTIITSDIGRYASGGVAAAAADRMLKAHTSK